MIHGHLVRKVDASILVFDEDGDNDENCHDNVDNENKEVVMVADSSWEEGWKNVMNSRWSAGLNPGN